MERIPKKALEGVKVADFSWAGVGPMSARLLADHGATVVRVESITKVDMMRVSIPWAGGISGINRSGSFARYNSSKYGMCLNLKHQRGLEIARRLIAWADVMVESFTPGAIGKMGLGYEDVKKVNPVIIMVSTSMQGQNGPHAGQSGFGTMLQGIAGFTNLTGWPDRMPLGLNSAYTDYIAPWYLVVAVLSALDYRKREGEGLHIDLSQFEAGVSFLSPAILDYTCNGRIQSAMGNRCQYAAPHGAYRCRGDDAWCVIAVTTEQEWQAFCKVLGDPGWTNDPRFESVTSRKEKEDELDRLVEDWTVNHHAEDVMQAMQAAGLASGVVRSNEDLFQDPHLRERHHFRMLNHPEMGMCAYQDAAFRLSKTPSELRPAPCLGEHTEYVCREILGMSDDEFVELLAEDVFK